MARTLEEVEQEITDTKKALSDVHGTETEVYARIVGYYRAVKNWNKGKREEYQLRKMFNQPETLPEINSAAKESAQIVTPNPLPQTDSTPVTYEIFTRKTCPNCPPVKEYISSLSMNGTFVDADTQEGLSEAASKGVMATPTVIFYNKAGIEVARCHSVEELKNIA